MYYFRAYAENSGGSDWADSTASFTTEALIAPTVISLPATGIAYSRATLNGKVTDIGSGNPLVTVYYGDDDAGEVAGNWDNSVSMGMKSWTFSTDIVGLAEKTTYYYRTFAENSAGSDWSDVTSFATASATDIALDAVSSGVNNDVTLSWSHLLGGGTDRAVVVGIGIEQGSVVISSVTFNSVAMTLAPGSLQVEGNNITAIYYMLEADLPSAGSYDIMITTNNGDSIGAGAVSLENVKQEPPEAVETASLGSSTYISQSITTLTDGAWIVDVVGSGDNASFDADSSQTRRFHLSPSSSAVAGSTRHVPTAGTVTNGWLSSKKHRICLSMAAFAPITVDPIPPTVVNASATDITYNSARLNGQVTNNGNEDPNVTVYWGESDGDETPDNWDYAETLGTQNSTFFSNISLLSVSTTYYFRAYAENSAGADWADSTASFATTPAPSAPTVVNLPATSVAANSARLNGEVTDNGYEDPTVTVYWGDEDGDVTPGNWDNVETIGTQNSTFINDVSSLSADTTYYFRAYASNSAGSDWADSTESFTTRVISPPIVVTLPATSVAANSTRLNGQVIDSGYEDPTVTVYWGESDGGMTPGNWDHTDVIGIQSSTFIHDVSSLSESTTYYFRAYASNSAGGDWAGSTESFTTRSGAPIAFDEVSFFHDEDPVTSLSWLHDLGGGGDRVVVVGIGIEKSGVVISSVTFDGESMTLAPGSLQVQGNNVTAIYYILEAELPSAGSRTVEVTTDIAGDMGAGAISLENVRQIPPEAVTGTTVGGGFEISQSITTLTDGAWIIDVVGNGNKTNFIPDSPQVERFNDTPSTSTVAGSTRVVPTAGTVTNRWTCDDDRRMCLSMAAFAPN